MRMIWSAKLICGIAGVCLAVATIPVQVRGQVAAATYSGPGDYTYDIHSMPDLDQRREGLPNDGNMYCVPTASMNLLAYAANFGFPTLPPFPGFWQGQPGHNNMTGWIDWLGQYMGTDGDGGTTTTGKIEGMSNWLSDSSQPMCVVSSYRTSGYWPNIDNAAFHATNGAIVQISYGRYFWEPGFQGVPSITDRDGGHAVTLKLAFANSGQSLGSRLLHYRNPSSDDDDLNSNTTFSSDWPISAANIDVLWDSDGDGAEEYFSVTSLINPPQDAGDERYRLIDSIMAIYPGAGLSFTDVQLNSVFVGGNLGFVQDQVPASWNVPTGWKLVSAIPHPEMIGAMLLERNNAGNTRLRHFAHNGRNTLMRTLPANSRCPTLGFGQDLYFSAGSNIYRIDLSSGSAISTRQGTAAGPVEHLAWDGKHNRLFGIAAGRAGVFDLIKKKWFDWGPIGGVGSGASRFRQLTVVDGVAFAALTDGRVVNATLPTESSALSGFSFRKLSLPNVADAISVDRDDQGRLYVSDNKAGLLEFEFSSRNGWQPVSKPHYDGPSMRGRNFVVFKNRANVRPGELDDREWFDIIPEDLGDSVIDIDD